MSIGLLEKYMRGKLSTCIECGESLIRVNKSQLFAIEKINLDFYNLKNVILNDSLDLSRVKSLGKFIILCFIEYVKTSYL